MNTKKRMASVILTVIFLSAALFAILNRTGILILLWKETELSSITHDDGYGYYAYVPDENVSRLALPVFLKEDSSFPDPGPLSVNEDLTAAIKENGGGRWQMQKNNDLYFSATDNQPKQHEYSILSPLIIRGRYLLLIIVVMLVILAANLFVWLKHKDMQYLRSIVRGLTAICFLMLLLPWNSQTFSDPPKAVGGFLVKPIIQRKAIYLCLLLILLVLNWLLKGNGKFLRILSILIIVINTIFYFLPEWNYYGLRADSSAYLQKYSASSIRTPGYPVFIEGVYKLTGNQGLADLREQNEELQDESLQNGAETESHGLLNIARMQKIVLAAAFLFFFAVWCRYYEPDRFILAAQILLCGKFLGVDNSYIMTECLSQAFLLIIAALILLTFKERKSWFWILLCVCSAASVLIRPANIFLVLPLAVCAIYLLRVKHKLLPILAGCLSFLAIAAIPAAVIYHTYGIFVWMPTSGYIDIARAVEILEQGDEDAFDDPELREFCIDLQERKKQYPDADQNTNMWQVGVAAALDRGYDLITCSPLLGKISRKIFMLHPSAFFQSLLGNIGTALERTRLQYGPITFPLLYLLFGLLFTVRIRFDSLLGSGFTLMHICHLILSMMNQPERRYIYSTEILCILGWLLIVVSLFNRQNADNAEKINLRT